MPSPVPPGPAPVPSPASSPASSRPAAASSKSAAPPRPVGRTMTARAPLRLATGAANAEILTGLREVVRAQVGAYVRCSREGPFTASQAGALHKLAQTYQLLAAGTAEEQGRYDLSGLTDGELAAALAQAGSGSAAGTE